MTVVFVAYRTRDSDYRFDRDYYVREHLPLVRRSWEPYGLLSATALFSGADERDIAVCVCEFRDEQSVRAAFGAPESAAVMADVANYTDLTARQYVGVSL